METNNNMPDNNGWIPVFSLSIDISSALRSVALTSTLKLKDLFSVSTHEEDSPDLTPSDDQDENTEG